jgi:hypothetical protein
MLGQALTPCTSSRAAAGSTRQQLTSKMPDTVAGGGSRGMASRCCLSVTPSCRRVMTAGLMTCRGAAHMAQQVHPNCSQPACTSATCWHSPPSIPPAVGSACSHSPSHWLHHQKRGCTDSLHMLSSTITYMEWLKDHPVQYTPHHSRKKAAYTRPSPRQQQQQQQRVLTLS